MGLEGGVGWYWCTTPVNIVMLLTTEDKALRDDATLGSLGVKEGTILYFKDLGPQISWRMVSWLVSHSLLTVTLTPHTHSLQSHSPSSPLYASVCVCSSVCLCVQVFLVEYAGPLVVYLMFYPRQYEYYSPINFIYPGDNTLRHDVVQ